MRESWHPALSLSSPDDDSSEPALWENLWQGHSRRSNGCPRHRSWPISLTKAYLPFKCFTSGPNTLLDFCLELIPWLWGGRVGILMTHEEEAWESSAQTQSCCFWASWKKVRTWSMWHQAQSPLSVDYPPTIVPLKMKANGESRWKPDLCLWVISKTYSLLIAQNSTKLGSGRLFVGPKIFDSRLSVQWLSKSCLWTIASATLWSRKASP